MTYSGALAALESLSDEDELRLDAVDGEAH